MRKHYLLPCAAALLTSVCIAQPTFTDATSLLNGSLVSGGCMGVCDMNGDGLDDIATLHNSRELIVEYQNPDGSFTRYSYGQVSTSLQWGMSLGDVDNDGHKDLVCGGNSDGVHHLQISAPGQSSLSNLNNGSLFMQCNNMADIDNDGWTDFFGCHDVGAPKIWLNDGAGLLSFANVMDFTQTTTLPPPSNDMSGNYGSTWTDFDNDGDIDLYISKCRQGVNDPDDPRRWNRLFVNNGNGTYSELTDTYGLTNHSQSWSSDFGDIDNDGDLDVVTTNHDNTIQLFENDGTGHYTEITVGSGLEQTGFFLQSIMRDFDNDGFLDILISGGTQYLFMNNGNQTFSQAALPLAGATLHSFGLGDLDNDGFVDILAGYGSGYVTPDFNNPDRVWLNDGNANHWFKVNLEGVASNRDAIGARTAIYGPWGVQIREVRAGESYGIVNSFTAHFGLGTATAIDSVMITWPSGTVDTYYAPAIDQAITAVEGVCIAPVASITPSALPVVCAGGTPITLTAPVGFNYLWSTGEITQSIDVNLGGIYSVTIDDGSGCSGSASLSVAENPDETPMVTASGDVLFCTGEAVTLTSSPSADYLWSNGEITQSIVVDQAGLYTVSTQGICGNFTSAPVEVTVLDPSLPIANDVTQPGPGVATVVASGDSITWYDVAVGGVPVGTGTSWDTPFLNATTDFWCSNTETFGGAIAIGAKTDSSDVGQYHGNGNNWQVFTANEAFTITSVKVYASGAGSRQIGLVDMDNNNTIVQGAFMVPDGESRVQLDFDVPAAGNYGLRIMSGNPQLWRDGPGSIQNYPYALGTFGEVTSSTVGGANATAYFYFFYDWEVRAQGWYCESDRVQVTVSLPVGMATLSTSELEIWPNPTDGLLSLRSEQPLRSIQLFDITGREVLRPMSSGSVGEVITMDVSTLAPGEYTLRLLEGDRTVTSRVMVR